MKNKIDDLRNHLFAALEGLSDPDKPMELDRARTIAEVAQVVINTAKVEVEFLKLYNGTLKGSDFVPTEPVVPGGRLAGVNGRVPANHRLTP